MINANGLAVKIPARKVLCHKNVTSTGEQTVFRATSLDGFIARPDGDIDWLTEFEPDAGEIGFKEFITSVDGKYVTFCPGFASK